MQLLNGTEKIWCFLSKIKFFNVVSSVRPLSLIIFYILKIVVVRFKNLLLEKQLKVLGTFINPNYLA